MSIIISPIITTVGLGVFTPLATGIEFTFTHVAVGTGTSAASVADTALEHEIARFPIAGGGMVTGGQAVSINALITNHANANPQNYDITELGFYGIDGASNTVLFAIYRQNTTIISKVSGADISLPFVLGLAALPVNNMTVQIDTNTSATLALLGQHVASSHPHTQYKRTLDNTERLKIATAVDADEAIRKDELDALRLRLIANGIDADLAVTNNATGLDFDNNQFKVAGTWYFDHALNTSTINTAGIITVKKVGNKAYQHEILENGQAANRVFTGIQWLPWVYQTGAVQGVVTFIPIDDYTDLNNFNTAGYFTFSTSDNVGHAPPTQGLESDYELQVLVTPSSGIIQIVKNITTNIGFVRRRHPTLNTWSVWQLTPPIEHIVTNTDVADIRSTGVYLCTRDTNSGLPNNVADEVYILEVRKSPTLQAIAQFATELENLNADSNVDFRWFRLIDDSNVNNVIVTAWDYQIYLYASAAPDFYTRIQDYINPLFEDYSIDDLTSLIHSNRLCNISLNLLPTLRPGFTSALPHSPFGSGMWYLFTLDDGVTDIPSAFTNSEHFCIVITSLLYGTTDPYGSPQVYERYRLQVISQWLVGDMYIRLQKESDWALNIPPPDWVIVP